jgi:multicomponent Na+:H+ antiporter subunit B
LAIARLRDLFSVVMLSGIYGLLSASFFVSLNAVDVAFTEAAVGAGISPILMLTTLTMLGNKAPTVLRNARIAFPLVIITGALLIVGTLDMPAFGDPNAPIHQHVAPRYIQESFSEIGVPNLVTAVLASYRGFDTFGEVVVIFTAGVTVMTLLLVARDRAHLLTRPSTNMESNTILRIVSKILIAPIMLFGLYVQFHGDYSPGGGFQAGVIFAAGLILYEMLFGLDVAERAIRSGALRFCTALGVMIYGGVGLLSFLSGRNFLDYDGLAADPIHGQHYGILLVELGVGITVAATMLIIYFTFARRVSKSSPPDVDQLPGQIKNAAE